MLLNENTIILLAVSFVSGLLSIVYLFSFFKNLKKLKLFSAVRKLLSLIVFVGISGFLSLLVLGTQGYKSLTKESLVANIKIQPLREQQFGLEINFPDGAEQRFTLNGDEVVFQAFILKWKPWANIIGVHTAYRLERISGRYKSIQDEKNKPRSVFQVRKQQAAGIAQWRENYSALSFLLDVEHGSASFVNASERKEYQLMVTTTGLLLRPLGD